MVLLRDFFNDTKIAAKRTFRDMLVGLVEVPSQFSFQGLKGMYVNNKDIYLTFIFLMAPFPKIEVKALLIRGLYLTCPRKTWTREGGVVKRLSTTNHELSMSWYTGNPTKSVRLELHLLTSNAINLTINKLWVSLHIIAERATYRRRCVPRHEDQGHWWVFLHSSDKSRLLKHTKKQQNK